MTAAAVATTRDEAEVRAWLISAVAQRARCAPDEIDPAKPISALGIDSLEAVVMIGELEEWLGVQLSAELIFDFPDLDRLAARIFRAQHPSVPVKP